MRASRWNLRHFLLLAGLALGAHGGLAQGQILHASGARPSFEVATIKLWNPPPPDPASAKPAKVALGSGGGQMTNRFRMIAPPVLLIAAAYRVPLGSENELIKGGPPDWMQQNMDQYEIEAKIDDAEFAAMQKMTPAQQREQISLMEQSLLADRFGLKIHFDSVVMPVYALVQAKNGANLTPAKAGEDTQLSAVTSEREIKMTATAVSAEQLAQSPFLIGTVGRMVQDQTGLKGAYDFTLAWQRDATAGADVARPPDADAPALFTAIQEQLGLRLAAAKAPVEVIVIDHVERPAGN